MFTKKTEMLYQGNVYNIHYTKDIIDNKETQFSIISVKSKSGISIWKQTLIISYYPLENNGNKTSMVVYQNENLNKLKIEIAWAIIVNAEQITP